MKKNQKFLIGNWKMNPETSEKAKKIFSEIKKTAVKAKKAKTIICPPFVFLSDLSKINSKKEISLGTQDVFWEKSGAFTGEISPEMVKSFKAEFTIVGHSERRELGETDKNVNLKVKSALDSGLKVIVCVGELERDKEGSYLEFLKVQIKEAFSGVQKKYTKNIIVAYEPVWAISKGKAGSKALDGEGVHQMMIFVRKILSDIFGRVEAEKIPILYGGSSGPENAEDILVNGKVQGFLVGSNSLKPEKFGEMIKIADSL
jgi:triosephosphate isomerase (TIM)